MPRDTTGQRSSSSDGLRISAVLAILGRRIVSVGLVGYVLVRIIASVIERAFHGLVRAAAAPLNPAGNP
jgi:hypothetical protein